ncbi:MAG: hypothetical protein KTR35_14885 [Gammaproteobacteria bacterium]|nr:hypothetical protein [Gammaproteobacteria bacterium]
MIKILGLLLLSMGLGACTSPETAEADKARVIASGDNQSEAASMTLPAPLTANLVAVSSAVKLGEPVLVKFSVTNRSQRKVRLLPWNTPLESRLNGDVFTIMHNGAKVLFVGRKIRRPEPTDADYVALAPGETLENTVDLAQAYNLSALGSYSIAYTPLVIAGVPTFSPDVAVEASDTELSIELTE